MPLHRADVFVKRTVRSVIAVAALTVTAVGGYAKAPWPQLKSIAWSPDGKGIAVLGLEVLQVWNAEAGVEEEALPVSSADRVLWSPDGQYVAAFSMFGRASIWNVRTGKRRTLPMAVSLAFSPDMRFIASGEEVKSFSRF